MDKNNFECNDGNEKTRSHWTTSFHSHRPIITVDFDHTITKNCAACKDWNGIHEIQDGVKESLIELRKIFEIVILTGGGAYIPNYKEIVRKCLDENQIPYDRIEDTKPPAVFLIDDRAIRHVGWRETSREIYDRMNSSMQEGKEESE